MTQEQRSYIAYLVRLWQVDDVTSPVWRASIEDPHSGERRGFASLDDLWLFLKQQMDHTKSSETERKE